MRAFPELAEALRVILDRLDATLRAGGNDGIVVSMYLAGGVAVNYYCGTRYTEDIDATFSHRLILPADLSVDYRRPDGSTSFLYLDRNYSTAFALLHDDYEARSVEWEGIGNDSRLVKLRVLSPLDLAVSKISRFSDQDREDILALAAERHFSAEELRARATDAIQNYVGDTRYLKTSLDMICQDVERLQGQSDGPATRFASRE